MLLKAVPEADTVAVDRARGRIDRAAGALRLNPFDARALQVARTLRQAADSITAYSMGPPGAEVVLREALAAGVDRAILVSDPALAGSDAQVTSRVLARALSFVPPGLVVLGARSSDAETGQVPPEIAAHLGWPLVAGARDLTRVAEGSQFVVTADGREGWVRWSVPLPFVLSTGEKIAKPPKPTETERAAAALRPIERWDLARLRMNPGEVGEYGSPTIVREVLHAAPLRAPRMFQGEDPSTLVRQALSHLRNALPSELVEPPRPGRGERPAGSSHAWIVAVDELGLLDPAALPMLREVRRAFPDTERTVVVAGEPPPAEGLRALGAQGAHSVLVLPGPFPFPGAAGLAAALRASAEVTPPEFVLLVADPFGREVAGRWAALSGAGLVGDATGMARPADGSLRWCKPAFGGQFEAWISGRTRPTLATVRPGVFAPSPPDAEGPLPSVRLGTRMVARGPAALRGEAGPESDPRLGDLESADRVVTVGMGIAGPEGIERLVPYLARWGAALGATRRVVDAGWLPVHRQVGLTGRSVGPKLAILLGVGKAANHVIGLRRAGQILAVNPDPAAPVFQYADAGIVAGWESVLPALDDALTRRDPAPSPGPH